MKLTAKRLAEICKAKGWKLTNETGLLPTYRLDFKRKTLKNYFIIKNHPSFGAWLTADEAKAINQAS